MNQEVSRSESILTIGNLGGNFSGWGTQRVLAFLVDQEKDISIVGDSQGLLKEEFKQDNSKKKHHNGLGLLNSVSIAGCDLLGSCLYTAGVCAANGGKLAPICLALVTFMLYYFRLVYNEVVSALPVNGGTYNLLLNTTSKKWAAFVACLSLLSYTATAIVSAFDSIIYLAILWPDVNIRGFTVLVIGLFTCITLCGVKESSRVTLCLFSIHTITLTILIIWGFIYGCQDNFSIFAKNWESHLPHIYSSQGNSLATPNAAASLFFGYSSALLGITGFETASNYVEELKSPEVFISTVNWMWGLSGFYNPCIALVAMMVLTMEEIYAHPSDMLAVMAEKLGGRVFEYWLCIDAVMILCGGVLTAIVGVTGLIERLAKDKVVPEELALVSSWGASYVAIISFSIFCITLFLCIFDPQDPTAINRFGGVFAISFLSVLAAFAFSAILLKLYRPNLARLVITKWWEVSFSLIAVLLGFAGNIVLTPDVFVWFLVYLFGLSLIVGYMILRVDLLGFGIWMLRRINMDSSKKKLVHKQEEAIINAYITQGQFEEFEGWIPVASEEAINPDVENQEFEDSFVSENGIQMISKSPEPPKSPIQLPRRGFRQSFNDSEYITKFPIRGKLLTYFINSLESIVTEPFVYFAKLPDPVTLHLAIEYISRNEQSDNIYIVHFVDDREFSKDLWLKAMNTTSNNPSQITQNYTEILLDSVITGSGQSFEVETIRSLNHTLPSEAKKLVDYVSILDTFYTYKKVHSIVVRGAYFCPSAIHTLCQFLKIRLNNTIMGVSDTYFKFPFAKISGCRLAIQDASTEVRAKVISQLSHIINHMK